MGSFAEQLEQRILLFDGAMGTTTHNHDLSLKDDYQGRENCPEILIQTHPDLVQSIHESFLAAGADAVETDTFGANKLVLGEFDLADRTVELNSQAAQVARAACEKYATGDRPRFVVGAIGPGMKLLTLGHTTWDQMFDSYVTQVRSLIRGGVDALLIETAQDLLQVKCAINACIAALEDESTNPQTIPIMVQATIETTGSMLMGTQIAAAATALRSFPIIALGLNCATALPSHATTAKITCGASTKEAFITEGMRSTVSASWTISQPNERMSWTTRSQIDSPNGPASSSGYRPRHRRPGKKRETP